MTRIVDGLGIFRPLGLACVALVAAPPSAVRAQIVGPGVYAWGDNQLGELGNGNTTNSSTPVPVTGLSGVNVTAVGGGSGQSLAVTSTGADYAWGWNNFGQLGNGTTTNSSTPIHVTGGGLSGVNVAAVAGGQNHSLAATSTGAVYAWGFNSNGQLGNGTTTDSHTPVPVTGLSGVNVTAIAAGAEHSLALSSTGAVYAWGDNAYGQLGNGTTTNSSAPGAVTGLSGVTVKAVAAGEFHSLALTSTGAVYAWGYDADGQLGNGNHTNALTALLVPFPANGSATVVSISAGYESSFALESDGSLWAWGDNSAGQYGNGTTTDSLTPIKVYTPTGGNRISSFADGQNGFQSLAIVTPVPEPGSLGLVIGVACFAGLRRLRRATALVYADWLATASGSEC